ncbi:MAG: DUF1549 domain-containing protein, partial [Acidobacteria bacterium]|nr:DUF1549 domain-containing protein [Acidobacteriota bacterium]
MTLFRLSNQLLLLGVSATVWSAETPEVLERRCVACHGATQQMGKVRLDQKNVAEGLSRRVLEMTASGKMPPTGPLPAAELASIRKWVEGLQPWSFSAIQKPAVPVGRNPIDHFVQAALAAKGIRPSAEADRRTLARRIHLDLTGLLPEPEEVEAFVRDS